MLTESKRLKICAGASAGGHMNELLKLLEHADSWPHNPDFYVTTLDILASALRKKCRTYVIGECDRRHPFSALTSFIRCTAIIYKERPDVVITTGSLPLAFLCLTGKVFGARIVWIDSIANIPNLSMSGRLVKIFADLMLTQWPELAEHDRNVEYAGAII